MTQILLPSVFMCVVLCYTTNIALISCDSAVLKKSKSYMAYFGVTRPSYVTICCTQNKNLGKISSRADDSERKIENRIGIL